MSMYGVYINGNQFHFARIHLLTYHLVIKCCITLLNKYLFVSIEKCENTLIKYAKNLYKFLISFVQCSVLHNRNTCKYNTYIEAHKIHLERTCRNIRYCGPNKNVFVLCRRCVERTFEKCLTPLFNRGPIQIVNARQSKCPKRILLLPFIKIKRSIVRPRNAEIVTF